MGFAQPLIDSEVPVVIAAFVLFDLLLNNGGSADCSKVVGKCRVKAPHAATRGLQRQQKQHRLEFIKQGKQHGLSQLKKGNKVLCQNQRENHRCKHFKKNMHLHNSDQVRLLM